MPKIRTNETYVSVRDFARGHGIDPAVFLEQVKRHIYDSGITLDDRIWSDNLVRVYNKMSNESSEEARKDRVDWYDLAYWVSKANEPEYGDMRITLKEIADHAHTTVDDVKAHAYDMLKTMRGIDCIEDVYWRGDADSPITFTKKKMWYEGRATNEATLMIRGGKPTGLLQVVGRIARAKNNARQSDMQGIFSGYMGLSNLLKSTAGLSRKLVPGKPYYNYSVSDELYRQYLDACKTLKLDYYTLDGQLVRNAPSKPAEPPKPTASPSTGACIPFEQCFYAKCWPDAEDYDGDPEYSWIKPGDLKKTLEYFDPEGAIWDDDKSYNGFLDRYMPDLKAAYEKAVKEYSTTGKAKAIEVGNSYDRVPKDLVPGLTTLYTVWPRPEARGARYQRECSLYMAIGPRDKFKF